MYSQSNNKIFGTKIQGILDNHFCWWQQVDIPQNLNEKVSSNTNFKTCQVELGDQKSNHSELKQDLQSFCSSFEKDSSPNQQVKRTEVSEIKATANKNEPDENSESEKTTLGSLLKKSLLKSQPGTSKEESKDQRIKIGDKSRKKTQTSCNSQDSLNITSHQQRESEETDRPNKYSGRLDVVRKTIFRQLKRFYKTLWKDEGYESLESPDNIFDLAKTFAGKYLGSSEENIDLFIVALIDNKKKYSNENSIYVPLRNEISSMMNRINK